MARIGKLKKFSENSSSHFVVQEDKPLYKFIKGQWGEKYFKNQNPITLELACGFGEYSINLAKRFSQRNFIGIDLKGERIWKGVQGIKEFNLTNVAFIKDHIQNIELVVDENEADEIWLVFPDPRPKRCDEKHRLTNLFFLGSYKRLLKPQGWFHLKTDNTELFEYSLDVLKNAGSKQLEFTYDLYRSRFLEEHFGVETKYEKIWHSKNESIKYLKCRLT